MGFTQVQQVQNKIKPLHDNRELPHQGNKFHAARSSFNADGKVWTWTLKIVKYDIRRLSRINVYFLHINI